MRLTIHRGTHEIGGSCVELCSDSGETRVVVDVGMPLVTVDKLPFEWHRYKDLPQEQLIEQRVLPAVDGLYSHEEPSISAVMLSHAHQDHYGFVRFLHPDIPLYMSLGTRSLVEVSNLFLGTGVNLDQVQTFTMWRPLRVGEFTITPYLMDHSAPDAAAFLIEADGQRLFYSGDFRGHGRKQVLLETLLKHPISDVDCLIMEGSMMGKGAGQYLDEAAVEQAMYRMMSDQCSYIFIFCSSQNLDRLVSIYCAVKRARKTLVIDLYTAFVLDKLSSISPRIPQFDWKQIRVLYAYSHATRIAEYDKGLLYKYKKAKIELAEIQTNPQDMVILVKDNPYFRTMLRKLGATGGAKTIYSMWHGYLERTDLTKILESNNIELIEIHTSGHAYVADLKKLAHAMNPRCLVPIHTFYPDEFRQIFSNVIQLKDGERMNLADVNKKRTGRALSHTFMEKLEKGGVYGQLVEAVREDKDLDIEFRGNLDLDNLDGEPKDEYINIYFKGNNILELHRNGTIQIDPVFTKGLEEILKSLKNEQDVRTYLKLLPKIKDNVATFNKKSMEIEYEQLLIRANNRESRNNSEYIIVDRQYAVDKAKYKWDLVAIKWPRSNRGGKQPEGRLAVIEVKYALNPQMAEIADQIRRYYDYLRRNMKSVCEEMELVLKQKLTLGLIERTERQISQLKNLKLDQQIESSEIILYLIDYNPNSKLIDKMIEKAERLDFAKQVRIACGGFALWDQSSKSLASMKKCIQLGKMQ